jgi:hypothetical protein
MCRRPLIFAVLPLLIYHLESAGVGQSDASILDYCDVSLM